MLHQQLIGESLGLQAAPLVTLFFTVRIWSQVLPATVQCTDDTVFHKTHTLLQSQQQHGTSTCKATFEYNQQLCRKKEGMVVQQGLLDLLACQEEIWLCLQ
eukprot:1139890-Pelagomonas_calceolata.AAC.2